MMHRRMPVVAERDIAEFDLRDHTHLIASHTAAHSTALTATAAASRDTTVMRRIDQGAACAGCGEAGPWRWTGTCPSAWWPWSWSWEPVIEKMLYYNITGVHRPSFRG